MNVIKRYVNCLLIHNGTPESAFGLCFLTMQWNLICLLETTEMILFQQFSWENYHLKVFFPKHKADQRGLNKDEAQHKYSNPIHPTFVLGTS